MDSQGTASDADAAPSKVSDSGVGDENWISDTEVGCVTQHTV